MAEPADSDDSPVMGLVITPDIFGLRPLFDDMVARLSSVWSMTTIAVEPFPGLDLGDDVEPRFAAVPTLDDDAHLRDLELAADATGCERVGLLGFCMGGMYCFKAARSDRFAKIASFYGMIRLPEAWVGPGQGEPLAKGLRRIVREMRIEVVQEEKEGLASVLLPLLAGMDQVEMRGVVTASGKVTLFPNVSIAGGIIQ